MYKRVAELQNEFISTIFAPAIAVNESRGWERKKNPP